MRHQGRLRRWVWAQAQGRRGEDLAHRYLRRLGYTIVARNYRTRGGSAEVDLIAWDGPIVVFIEVKTRASEEFGTPDRAVDELKRHQQFRAAGEYLKVSDLNWNVARFDIVNVVIAKQTKIRHVIDAFKAGSQL